MPDKFIPEKIRDFLTERPGRRYCDSCIQERLGLRWRQQVQLVTATLAVTRLFERDRSVCCTCNEEKHVIAALQIPPSHEERQLTKHAKRTAPASADRPHSVKLVLAAR